MHMKKKAFTLLELLVVLAILGIVASLIVAFIQKLRGGGGASSGPKSSPVGETNRVFGNPANN